MANSVKVLKGKTSKIAHRLSYMIEARSQNNLPMGIVVNRTMVTPTKSKSVPVTLCNTNSYNVWIWQSLLTTDIVEVEHCPWDYQSVMSHDGDQVQVSFCPVPTPEVQADILSSGVINNDPSSNSSNSNVSTTKESGEWPKFGPRPEFNSSNFDFKKELE